jgi:chondroitin AC lyase
MAHNFFRMFFVGFLIMTGATRAFANSDTISQQKNIDHIREKCRQLLLSDTAYATERSYMFTDDIKYSTDSAGYLRTLTQGGYWRDIDYRSPMRSSWKPSWHLYRVMLLYRAYYKYKNQKYLDAVHLALHFWISHDFQCSNWWQNQINIPFAYTSLMIMLGNEATADELSYMEDKIIKRISIYKPTGQNLIWQYDNQARVALIHRDQDEFNSLMKGMQQVIQVSVKEGIQPDYSFQQHGAMLQFGNYGMHFVNSLLFWMNVTAGSKFSFAPGKQEILFKYCVDGLKWTIYKGGMDITGIGRQIRKDYAIKRGSNLFDDFNLIKQIDPDKDICRYTLDGFTTRQQADCTLNGNKGFWRSAYMIQRDGGNYMMSVKTHGGTVKKVESINGENLKGSFLNDGVTLIQRTGLEYRNIEALWNWDMLPGTTCDTTVDPGDRRIFGTSNDGSAFVGQLSNEHEGISTMYYNRLGVTAYKSYFFVNDMMIALGAGITSPNTAHVVTTLNQRFYHGKTLITGTTADSRQWLWQDSIGYFSLNGKQDIKSRIERRTGNWFSIDQASDNKLVSDSLLTLYIGHDQTDQYAYMVKPSVGLAEAKSIAQNHLPTVISNTTEIQGIAMQNLAMIVFYKPSTISILNTRIISVDHPCIILYKNDGNQPQLWVSDPTRKLDTIHVTIDKQILTVRLPRGDLAGSTAIVKL